MTITVLPTPIYSRLQATADVDPSGRFVTYNPLFKTDCTDYDYTHSGTIERYDPSAGAWSTLAESVERIHTMPDLMDASGRLSLITGQNLISSISNALVTTNERYDPSTNTWSTLAAFPGSARQAAAGWIDASGVVWVGGGLGFSDLYSFAAGSWTTRASAASEFGLTNSLVDSTGKAYFLGSTSGSSTTVQIYNPSTNTWSTTTAPAAVRGTTACMTTHDQLFAIVSGTGNCALYRYDIASATWSTMAAGPGTHPGLSNFPDVIRYHPTVDAIFMFGMQYISGTTHQDLSIYKYDLATDTWSTTPDSLSTWRSLSSQPAFDGTGFYIPQGTSPGSCAVNVVEYLVPAGAVVASVGHSFGLIID